MSFVSGRTALRQAVLLKLVAELAEGHTQKLGGLRLDAAGPIQGALQIAPLEVVEGSLEVQALLRDVDKLGPPCRALAPYGLGQGAGAEHVSGPEHDCPLEDILELPDVAGPMVALQDRQRFRRDPTDVFPELLAEFLQEVCDEEGDVLAALAQGWQVDGEHIQTVEQVFAHHPVAHRGLEVAVRRRDEAHVGLDVARVSDATNLTHLDGPQELDL